MANPEDDLFGDSKVLVAPNPNTQDYRPAYRVTKLNGNVERPIYKKNEKTGKVTKVFITEPAGFILEGMKRHQGIPVNSIRVRDIAGLRSLGVSHLVPVYNGQGDQVGTQAL